MTTTGGLIEASLSHVTHLIALLHVVEDLFGIDDGLFRQFVDVDALNTLTNIQVLVHWINQIVNTLVVDLRSTTE